MPAAVAAAPIVVLEVMEDLGAAAPAAEPQAQQIGVAAEVRDGMRLHHLVESRPVLADLAL
jgi:hypothetical protein